VRKNYCGMVYGLDLTIGNMLEQLKQNDLWENTYLIFFSDNGGASGLGSGYPLRGVKKTLFEGGIRTPAFVNGGKLPSSMRGQVLEQSVHITDWFATICSFANIDCSPYNLDGIDLSGYLTAGTEITREYLLLNVDQAGCDTIFGTDLQICGGIRYNEWKLVVGNQINGGTDDYFWDINYINNSNIDYTKATVQCNGEEPMTDLSADCASLNAVCLFDISNDPCEYYDLSSQYPSIVADMLAQLNSYYEIQQTPVQFLYDYDYFISDPDLYGGYWSPWSESSSTDDLSYVTNNNDVDPESIQESSSHHGRKFASMLVSSLI